MTLEISCPHFLFSKTKRIQFSGKSQQAVSAPKTILACFGKFKKNKRSFK
jgi:hypothetical protein